MKILKEAMAGSLESSDCLVMVKPSDSLEIEIESIVMKRYGNKIRAAVMEALHELDVTAGYYKVQDRGALDFCIKARIITASRRGCDNDNR
jgi:citrate lyase subunit gamma (acyl carrier protein)